MLHGNCMYMAVRCQCNARGMYACVLTHGMAAMCHHANMCGTNGWIYARMLAFDCVCRTASVYNVGVKLGASRPRPIICGTRIVASVAWNHCSLQQHQARKRQHAADHCRTCTSPVELTTSTVAGLGRPRLQSLTPFNVLRCYSVSLKSAACTQELSRMCDAR